MFFLFDYRFTAAITNCSIVNTPPGLIHDRARSDHFELLKREMSSNPNAYDDGTIVVRLAADSAHSNANPSNIANRSINAVSVFSSSVIYFNHFESYRFCLDCLRKTIKKYFFIYLPRLRTMTTMSTN